MVDKLKPILDSTVIYARPDGRHYHIDRKCCMLQGSDFETYGYVQIAREDIRKRKLNPCACSYKNDGGQN